MKRGMRRRSEASDSEDDEVHTKLAPKPLNSDESDSGSEDEATPKSPAINAPEAPKSPAVDQDKINPTTPDAKDKPKKTLKIQRPSPGSNQSQTTAPSSSSPTPSTQKKPEEQQPQAQQKSKQSHSHKGKQSSAQAQPSVAVSSGASDSVVSSAQPEQKQAVASPAGTTTPARNPNQRRYLASKKEIATQQEAAPVPASTNSAQAIADPSSPVTPPPEVTVRLFSKKSASPSPATPSGAAPVQQKPTKLRIQRVGNATAPAAADSTSVATETIPPVSNDAGTSTATVEAPKPAPAAHPTHTAKPHNPRHGGQHHAQPVMPVSMGYQYQPAGYSDYAYYDPATGLTYDMGYSYYPPAPMGYIPAPYYPQAPFVVPTLHTRAANALQVFDQDGRQIALGPAAPAPVVAAPAPTQAPASPEATRTRKADPLTIIDPTTGKEVPLQPKQQVSSFRPPWSSAERVHQQSHELKNNQRREGALMHRDSTLAFGVKERDLLQFHYSSEANYGDP